MPLTRKNKFACIGVGLAIGGASAWIFHSNPTSETSSSLEDVSAASQSISPARSQFETQFEAPPTFSISGFEARLHQALSFESKSRRAWELELLFRNLSAETAPAIYQQLLSSLNKEPLKEALNPFWESWGTVDGKAAYAAAETLTGSEKSTALKHLLPTWAKQDALAVWALYVDTLQDSSSLDFDTANAILFEAAKKSPDSVFKVASETADPWQDQNLRSALMMAAAESNQFDKLAAKLDQLSTTEKRDQWTWNIYWYWASKDSAQALTSIEAIEDPDLAKGARKGYLTGLYLADPVSGLKTIFSQKETPVARNVLSELLPVIMQRQTTREEMSAFIDTLKQEQLLDLLTPKLKLTASWSDPTLAVEIADKLEGEERNSLIKRTVSSWVRRDFDAALAYYEGLSSAEEKSQIAPLFIDQLPKHSDGGTSLTTILGNLPPSRERTAIIENLLSQTRGARTVPSTDFLLALELISASEPNLSIEAIAARDSLFKKEPGK